MQSKNDESASMSDTVFVKETLGEVYTVQRFGSKKAAQIEAYDFLKKHIRERPLTLRRVRSFFEGKAKVIRGEEKDAVRAAKREEARREYRELCARLDSLDETLARMDEDFTGPYRDALRSSMRGASGIPAGQGSEAEGLCSLDRARNRGNEG